VQTLESPVAAPVSARATAASSSAMLTIDRRSAMQQQMAWTSTKGAGGSTGLRVACQSAGVLAGWAVALVLLVGLLLATQGVGFEAGPMADAPRAEPGMPLPMPEPGPGPG
jgi:hypothetical protein